MFNNVCKGIFLIFHVSALELILDPSIERLDPSTELLIERPLISKSTSKRQDQLAKHDKVRTLAQLAGNSYANTSSTCSDADKVAKKNAQAACKMTNTLANAGAGVACAAAIAASGGMAAPLCGLGLALAVGTSVCDQDDCDHEDIVSTLAQVLTKLDEMQESIHNLKSHLEETIMLKDSIHGINVGYVQYRRIHFESNPDPTKIDDFMKSGAEMTNNIDMIASYINHSKPYKVNEDSCLRPDTYWYLNNMIIEGGFLAAAYDVMNEPDREIKDDFPRYQAMAEALAVNFKNYWSCASVGISLWYQDNDKGLASYRNRNTFSYIEAYGGAHENGHLRTWNGGCGPQRFGVPYCRWQLIPSTHPYYFVIKAGGEDYGAYFANHDAVQLRSVCVESNPPDECLWKFENTTYGSEYGWRVKSRKGNLWWTFYWNYVHGTDSYIGVWNTNDSNAIQMILVDAGVTRAEAYPEVLLTHTEGISLW